MPTQAELYRRRQQQAEQMAQQRRRQAAKPKIPARRVPAGLRPAPTPRIVSQPPTPPIGPPPGDIVEPGILQEVMGRAGGLLARGTPLDIYRERAGAIATGVQQDVLNPLLRAFGMSPIPAGDIMGGQTGDWRGYLGQAQQVAQRYGFGYGQTWGQPGGFLGGPDPYAPGWGTGAAARTAPVATAADYDYHGARWSWSALSYGSKPSIISEGAARHFPTQDSFGMEYDEFLERIGYVKDGDIWTLTAPGPTLDTRGYGAGYGPGYGPYSGGTGRYRRPAAATAGAGGYSLGLVNWRIGL